MIHGFNDISIATIFNDDDNDCWYVLLQDQQRDAAVITVLVVLQ